MTDDGARARRSFVTAHPANELVDIVDEEDRVVGRRPRAEVRRDNLPHRSVYVLVFNHRGELFVHQRTHTKDIYPGYQDVAIGGVLHAGEGYAEAAARELSEELGVSGATPQPLFAIRYHDAITTVNGMVFRWIHDGPFALQATEIISGEFVDPGVLRTRMLEVPFCPDGAAVLAQYHARVATPKS